jgi:two-component system, cell cycle sensor histidine kinase and response regulator CckA
VNAYAYIPLAAFLINGFTWVFIHAKRRRSPVNQAYLLFAGLLALWALHDHIAWSPVSDAWQRALTRVEPLLWLSLGFVFLHFVYAFLRRERDVYYYISLSLVLIAIPLALFTDLVYTGYEPTFYGVRKTPGELYLFLPLTNVALPCGFAQLLILRRRSVTVDPERRTQLGLVLAGTVIALLLGLVTDVVLPYMLGIKVLPALASSLTVVIALSVYRAVVHHNFLAVSVQEAARNLFENASDGIILLDRNRRTTLMNRAAEELLQLDDEDTFRSVASILEQDRGAEERPGDEVIVYSKTGPTALSVSRSAVRRGKADLGWFVILRDITGRKRTEEAIRQSEERYRMLFNSGKDALFVFRLLPEGGASSFIEVNDVACTRLDYTRQELLALRPQDLASAPALRELAAAVEPVRQRGEVRFETTLITKGAREIPVEIVAQLFELDEEPTVLAAVRDVTEQHAAIEEYDRLEAQLRQAQKMEAIGTLAGGIAHDMNNVLGAIMSLASVMRVESDSDDPHQRDVEEILVSCKQGRDLTQNLLGFARKGRYERKRLSINRIVDDVTDVLQRTITEKISIKTELARELRLVEGDPNQFTGVLTNVCLNAVDAMQPRAVGEATLTVSTDLCELSAAQRRLHPELAPGPYVRLRVRDTGVGMSEETLERAFEPFFSTKARGRGTGLGLAMVYGTVVNHGGLVQLTSEEDAGTTMTICLPAMGPGEVESETTGRIEIPTMTRQGTVLLVDDEELIRTSGQRLLRALGYRVLLAEDGAEAVEIFGEQRSDILMVVLDMVMPVMDGVDTFLKLRELDPKVKILLTSGHTLEEKAAMLLERGARGFLQKPYTLDALAEGMYQVLEED